MLMNLETVTQKMECKLLDKRKSWKNVGKNGLDDVGRIEICGNRCDFCYEIYWKTTEIHPIWDLGLAVWWFQFLGG